MSSKFSTDKLKISNNGLSKVRNVAALLLTTGTLSCVNTPAPETPNRPPVATKRKAVQKVLLTPESETDKEPRVTEKMKYRIGLIVEELKTVPFERARDIIKLAVPSEKKAELEKRFAELEKFDDEDRRKKEVELINELTPEIERNLTKSLFASQIAFYALELDLKEEKKEGIKQLTDGNFESEVFNVKDKPVLVEFSGSNCMPCMLQSWEMIDLPPELRKKIAIVKIDVDQNENLADKYIAEDDGGYDIPVLLIFYNGQLVKKFDEGVQKTELLKEELEKYIQPEES